MGPQPSADDRDWAGRNARTRGRPARSPGRAVTSEADIVDLAANERNLETTRDGMVDDLERLNEVVGEYARAVVAWEVHQGRWVEYLDDAKVRSNEHLRRAYALSHNDDETGESGADLYRAYITAKTHLEALQIALNAKRTIASATQTLINHGSRLSGLPDPG